MKNELSIMHNICFIWESIKLHRLPVTLLLINLSLAYYVFHLNATLAQYNVVSKINSFQPMSFIDNIMPADEPRSAVEVSWPNLALSASPVVLVFIISVSMKLQLEKPLIIGMSRSTIQLTVLGLILGPIFELKEWYYVMSFSFLQILLASREVIAIAIWHYSLFRMFLQNVICIGLPCFLVVLFAQLYTLEYDPFYAPQYWIPFSGMLIGNASRSNSLLTISLIKDLAEKQDQIEWVISRGGSKWEATNVPIKNAISSSLYPVINSMMIAGLIQIPGTMVGTILGGTDPFLAAKYQILVYILIFATSAFGSLLQTLFTVMNVFDLDGRLISNEVLHKKKKGSKDWVSALFYLIFRILKYFFSPICLFFYERCCNRCSQCCRFCPYYKKRHGEEQILLG